MVYRTPSPPENPTKNNSNCYFLFHEWEPYFIKPLADPTKADKLGQVVYYINISELDQFIRFQCKNCNKQREISSLSVKDLMIAFDFIKTVYGSKPTPFTLDSNRLMGVVVLEKK